MSLRIEEHFDMGSGGYVLSIVDDHKLPPQDGRPSEEYRWELRALIAKNGEVGLLITAQEIEPGTDADAIRWNEQGFTMDGPTAARLGAFLLAASRVRS